MRIAKLNHNLLININVCQQNYRNKQISIYFYGVIDEKKIRLQCQLKKQESLPKKT